MLKVSNICFSVSDKQILKDISLEIKDGEFVVITGPNGGGKSTLARVICGIEKQTSGKIFVDDIDLSNMDITERANSGIGFAFQQPVRFKGLTVRDLLVLSNNNSSNEIELRNALTNVGLCAGDYIDRPLDTTLSGGEAKRIEIAMMLLRNSKVMIFDEPEAGIDLWSFSNLIDVFENLKLRHDRSIIVISHQERIMNKADRIIVLSGGQITANDKRENILPDILSGKKCCFSCERKEECTNGCNEQNNK